MRSLRSDARLVLEILGLAATVLSAIRWHHDAQAKWFCAAGATALSWMVIDQWLAKVDQPAILVKVRPLAPLVGAILTIVYFAFGTLAAP